MNKILFLSFLLLASFSSFAQELKKVDISPDDAKLREELRKDDTVSQINCGLFEKIDVNQPYAQTRLKAQAENSRIRLLLYEASQSKDKTVKAKIVCYKDERTDPANYLVVENGKVKYMGDYVPDGKGGLRLNSMYCDKLDIGTLAAKEKGGILDFQPLADKNYDGKILILQCRSGKKRNIF